MYSCPGILEPFEVLHRSLLELLLCSQKCLTSANAFACCGRVDNSRPPLVIIIHMGTPVHTAHGGMTLLLLFLLKLLKSTEGKRKTLPTPKSCFQHDTERDREGERERERASERELVLFLFRKLSACRLVLPRPAIILLPCPQKRFSQARREGQYTQLAVDGSLSVK